MVKLYQPFTYTHVFINLAARYTSQTANHIAKRMQSCKLRVFYKIH